MAKKRKRSEHRLRLIRWAQDGYPPINFTNEVEHVIKLVQEFRNVEHELEGLIEVCKNLLTLEERHGMRPAFATVMVKLETQIENIKKRREDGTK